MQKNTLNSIFSSPQSVESYPGGNENSLCETVASCFESQRAVCECEVAQESLSAFDIATLKVEEAVDQMITQHPADDFTRVSFVLLCVATVHISNMTAVYLLQPEPSTR